MAAIIAAINLVREIQEAMENGQRFLAIQDCLEIFPFSQQSRQVGVRIFSHVL